MKRIKLILCFSFITLALFCQSIVPVNSGQRKLIGRTIQYFIDSTNALSAQQVISRKFLDCKTEILNLGILADNVWMKFPVRSETEEQLYLEVMAPLMEELELYRMVDGTPLQLFAGGFNNHFKNRPVRSENWLFTLDNPRGTSTTYLVKGRTGFNFQVPIAVSAKEAYVESAMLHNLFWGIYIGTMIFAIIYNLFIYFSVRERRYFYYILYVIGTSVFYLALQGFSFMFFWPDHPAINKHTGAFICITNMIITLFTMDFLKIARAQKWQYFFGWLIIISFGLIAVVNLAGPYQITTAPAQLMSLVIAAYCIYAGFKGLRRGIHDARYFVTAWTLFSILTMIFVLTINNVIPSNFFTTHCIFIGHMTEVMLLSFALADRINSLKKANERFQKEILRSKLEIQEQTFKSIAQELHDNIGQILSVANLNLNSINLNSREKAREKISDAQELLGKAIHDIRDLSKTLNTDTVSTLGLTGAISLELKRIEKTGALTTTFEIEGEPVHIDPEIELIVFRITQESFHNIIKHANASSILVYAAYKQHKLWLVIKDDGVGFDVKSGSNSGNGLINIESRCKMIKGNCKIESVANVGTQLTIDVPLNN